MRDGKRESLSIPKHRLSMCACACVCIWAFVCAFVLCAFGLLCVCFRACVCRSYLSPGGGDPLQTVVPGTASEDTGLLSLGPLVQSAHAVWNHHSLDPWVGTSAEHTPLPHATTTRLGALTTAGMRGGLECWV